MNRARSSPQKTPQHRLSAGACPFPEYMPVAAGVSGSRCQKVATLGTSMLALILAGCQHHDAVDTTLSWYQHYKGGVIAQQRPPPPGQYAPYPKVGLTPTSGPSLPSPALRQSLTESLIGERNLEQRIVAQNGTLTPEIPLAPGELAAQQVTEKSARPDTTPSGKTGAPPSGGASPGAQAAPTIPNGMMGATLDAAESQPTTPQPGKNATAAAPVPSAPTQESKAARPVGSGDEPEVAMPAFQEPTVKGNGVVGPMPEIPAAPPLPPAFPGFAVPSDAALPDMKRPDYDISQPDGTVIRFMPGSDQVAAGQDAALAKLVSNRAGGSLFVHGSGETVSMGAQDQARAVNLGLLRARTLADALIKRGVPASSVHIFGSAFGPASRVSTKG